MIAIILGLALIILQIFSYIGNISSGTVFFTNFSIYEIISFVFFNLVGIIGLVFLIIGIRSKLNKEEDDEEPYEYVSKPVRAPVIETVTKTVKQPKETMYQTPIKKRSILSKIYSFLLQHKKKVYLSTLICITLLVISLIGYNVYDSKDSDATRHYIATAVKEESHSYVYYRYTVGCGASSCPYCNGIKISVKNTNPNGINGYDPDLFAFYRYGEISERMYFFENCGIVFLMLSMFTAGLSLIIFVPTAIKKAIKGQDFEE